MELEVPVTFENFVISLSSSALVYMGELPEPTTGKKQVDLKMAKHAIDTLDMLKEKTRGNLSEEEEKLLTELLADLKLKFVKLQKGEGG